MVEASVLKNPEVHGGSGFGAATVQDLGFEPTLGATSGEGVPKRVRNKMIEVGEGLSAAGVSAAGVSAGAKPKRAPTKNLQVPVPEAIETVAEGVSAGSKPKRTRKKKGEGVSGGALLSLKDLGAMHGQPEPTIQAKFTVKAEGADRTVGEGMSGGLRRKRIEIVKEVMKKHKLSLPAASKYVKEHKLY
jgi:hypothetical protein